MPADPAFSVSETPVPPVVGAGTVTSPVVAMFMPNAESEDVPTVASGGTYGSTVYRSTLPPSYSCTLYVVAVFK
jgi:hypothetical protein